MHTGNASGARAKLRWGVLGAANIATGQVIPAMQRSSTSTVVAIGSRDVRKAQRAAATGNIARAYGSYQEVLDDDDVDAVYIPLPNHLHAPWAIRAIDAGKHVLCEKPIALSADEARTIRDAMHRFATRGTSLVVGEAFMARAHPQWERVRTLVDDGTIGDLRVIHGHFSYFRTDPNDVRSRAEWGGGAMLDIGCYPITISRALFREQPTEAVALVELDPTLGIDRLASVILRFPSGQATFTCAGQLVLHQSLQLFGTRGRIGVEVPFNAPLAHHCTLTVNHGRDLVSGDTVSIVLPLVDQYREQAEQFVRAVRGEGAVPVTIDDAIANMAVLDAIARSARSHAWEPVH